MATQLVILNNDSVEVSYPSGARLELSPCGATFVFYRPLPEDHHPLHVQPKVQQNTQFVTSEFREAVVEALDFRNRFASHPYICPSVQPDLKYMILHEDVHKVTWPRVIAPSQVEVLCDGSCKLVSLDSYASILLAPSQCHFTVQFLSRISQVSQRVQKKTTKKDQQQPCAGDVTKNSQNKYRTKPSEMCSDDKTSRGWNNSHNDTGSGGGKADSRKLPDQSRDSSAAEHDGNDDSRWTYAWITQYHSVQDYPDCWNHPLKLLMEVNFHDSVQMLKDGVEGDSGMDSESGNKENSDGHVEQQDKTLDREENDAGEAIQNEETADHVTSKLPSSLPLKCSFPHLHKWNYTRERQERIKVICDQGIIYRLMWNSPRGIEVYPGDGSMMKSTGIMGQFFTHLLRCHDKVEERMYSIQNPPPTSSDLPYVVSKLINRASTYLQHVGQESQQLSPQQVCCWKQRSSPHETASLPPSRTLIEECTTPGLGRFTAYSSGHLRAVFTDRTCADMWVELTRSTANSDDVSTLCSPLLPSGVCRLLLPSGHYRMVDTQNPGKYQRYTSAMLEWARWVNTRPSERHNFYKGTIYDPEQLNSVQHELQKINCFNCILSQITKSYLYGVPADSEQLGIFFCDCRNFIIMMLKDHKKA